MIQRLLYSICFFLLFSFGTIGAAQTVQDLSKNVKNTENFSWRKLHPQKSVYGICESTQKTMVFIYSDIPNFGLADGDVLVYPVSSTFFVGNIKKHVFCLSHPAPYFIVKNDSASNSQINVASFVVTANADKLAEMEDMVEQAVANENTLAAQNNDIQMILPVNQLGTSPPIPASVTYDISWEKLSPQKIEKYPCSDSNKTIVFIYSDIANFVLHDGDNIFEPTSSVLFVQNIKQSVFCIEHPTPYFGLLSSNYEQTIQKEAAAFVVGRNKENAAEIVKLVKQTLKEQHNNLAATNLSENKTVVQAEKLTLASNSLPAAETVPQTLSVDADVKILGKIQTQQELFNELQKDESGYRIQLMAKRKLNFTAESIAKYFGIPYDIKIDYDGTWYRFTIGYFKTLGDAESTLANIYSRYHLKEYPVVSLYKNEARVCVFLK